MTYRDHSEMLMRAMPATRTQLRERSHVSRSSVTRWIAELRKCGWCYIGDWVKPDSSGPFLPVYYAGIGKDKPCKLVAQTNAESTRKSRAKAAAEGRRAGQLERDRIAKAVKRARMRGEQPTPFDALMK